MRQYLLDANIFIQAKNLHYGFDFCPAFWEWILNSHNANTVFSIDKVYDELTHGDDDLSNWVKDNNTLFLPSDSNIIQHFATISNWVQSQNFDPSAIQTFYTVADYYLIAHALAGNYTIVTHEVVANSPKRIKIPNVCMALGVNFVTPFTMLRHEKAKFVLG